MVSNSLGKQHSLAEGFPTQTGNQAGRLAENYLDQLARVMSFPKIGTARFLLGLLFGRAVRHFAELTLALDHEVECAGPAAGVSWLLPHFVSGIEARGIELIPDTGPLVIAANHPSSYDALVISACVHRPDYKIIIGDIPPYRHLPHVSQHAIFAPPATDTFGRMKVLRAVMGHLEAGGALLMFPRGDIEPDPAFMPDPGGEFQRWSRSLEIVLRRVPQTRVLVTIVSGVISPAAMRHPLTWLRSSCKNRQRLAYIYQITRQVLSGKELFGLRPHVTFGEYVSGQITSEVMAKVEGAANRTLQQHLSWIHA